MRRGRRQRGLSLLETCAVISLVGVLAAAFLPTFLRNVRTSKIAEAPEMLEQMHQRSAAYFAAFHRDANDGRTRQHCLPDATEPAPALPSVTPVAVDFSAETTPGFATWRALGFSPQRELRFRYTFAPVRSGCDLHADPNDTLLKLIAEGDLDGDNSLSHFERHAGVDAHGALVPVDVLLVDDRIE